jgi:hypothetical protein
LATFSSHRSVKRGKKIDVNKEKETKLFEDIKKLLKEA